MIGQYVYTRNDGSILIGPHGSAIEGLSCVGRTESIRQEDLVVLHELSVYTRAVRKKGSDKEYIPHWNLTWLPSGGLAVGKVTYFPPNSATNERNNHLAHFYVLDRQSALEISGNIEQLFTLPFIDYDLTYHTDDHDMAVLTRLQDRETLQECGATETEIIPLGTLLNQHLPLYTDEVRNIVEAVCDSVVHGNRQTLFTYDCYADNAMWLCAQWLGWIYRLLPLQIRSQTNISIPYHSNCTNSTHLSMIPAPLVRVRNGYASYCSTDDENASTVPMGFNYLYAEGRFYHQPNMQAQLPELYNAQSNYFCAFLQKQIDDLYDCADASENDGLQDLYRGFYSQGWRNNVLLDSADGLELMISTLGNLDQLMPLSEEAYQEELYFWMEHLGRIMAQRALPLDLSLSIQRNLLLQLYQDGKIIPSDRWLSVLSQVLATTPDTDLASDCVDWASIACAKLFDQGENSLTLAKTRFSQVSFAGTPVDQLVLTQLMTEGDEARRLKWEKAGIRCDADAAMNRIIRYVTDNIGTASTSAAIFRGLEDSAELIDLLPAESAEKMRRYMAEYTDKWCRSGHLTADLDQLDALYRKFDATQAVASNTALLENTIVRLMAKTTIEQIRAKYASAGIPELAKLQELGRNAANPRLRNFIADLCRTILERIRKNLQSAPLDSALLSRCAQLLDVSDDAADWNVYNKACGMSMGLTPGSTVPEFLTPQWLAELREAGALRYRQGYQQTVTICVLDQLLNELTLTPELSGLIRPESGGSDLDRIRAGMFRSGRYLPSNQVLFGICQRTAVSGLTNADAVILLEKFGVEKFMEYLDWLRDNRPGGKVYLAVLKGLAQRRDILCGLDQETFLGIMAHLNFSYMEHKTAIYISQEANAVQVFEALWETYTENKGMLLRMKKRNYAIHPIHRPTDGSKKPSGASDSRPETVSRRPQGSGTASSDTSGKPVRRGE